MRLALLASVLLLLPLGTADAQALRSVAARSVPRIMLPDSMMWGAAPPSLPAGASATLVHGDPSKAGAFTIRLRMPDGYRIPPHTHASAENVTVLSGTLLIGMGSRMDESAMQALPAGAFVSLAGRARHSAMARGETVIQIHGTGPFDLDYITRSDDPRRKAASR